MWHSIYLSTVPVRLGPLCYCTLYFQIIFINIILSVHNDPCFEDKLSSLTLKYRPVHFFENSCKSMLYVYILYMSGVRANGFRAAMGGRHNKNSTS